ncbi:hypothetical protein LSTR_LSTR011672 [Laodelphax striatellus]|uniref:Uncharacterized protein n=1 Tax=Laodelphax striatellus TaxID=195883 RepID=A0A482WUW2_LAOST|nr:hypothetical protein LSTR_LSTR015344 [Laodelphax striatellus]RZF37395.1 hypothetical protein LSTR_LSTR011672 [Laodelphax striatellus]
MRKGFHRLPVRKVWCGVRKKTKSSYFEAVLTTYFYFAGQLRSRYRLRLKGEMPPFLKGAAACVISSALRSEGSRL